MPTALVITPIFPRPVTSGVANRIRSTLQFLKRTGFRVHLLFFLVEDYWKTKFDFESSINAQEFDHLHVAVAAKARSGPANGKFYLIDEWWDPALEFHLKWLASTVRIDLCLVNYIFLSKALEFLPKHTFGVIDTHDVFTERNLRLRQVGLTEEFFWTSREQEREGLQRADAVLAISQSDINALEELASRRVRYVPYVSPLYSGGNSWLQLNEQRSSVTPFRFGYLGSASTLNRRMLLDFATSPAVERFFTEFSSAEISIPGPLARLIGETQPRFIRSYGEIQNVREFYAAMNAVVIPKNYGTGQQTKVIEACDFGVPLIASASATAGLTEVIDLAHRCDTVEDVVGQMRSVILSEARQRHLAEASTELSKENQAKFAEGTQALLAQMRARTCPAVDMAISSRIASSEFLVRLIRDVTRRLETGYEMRCRWLGSRDDFFDTLGDLNAQFVSLDICEHPVEPLVLTQDDVVIEFGLDHSVSGGLAFDCVEELFGGDFRIRASGASVLERLSVNFPGSDRERALVTELRLVMPVLEKEIWLVVPPQHDLSICNLMQTLGPSICQRVFINHENSKTTNSPATAVTINALSELHQIWNRHWSRPWLVIELTEPKRPAVLEGIVAANSVPEWKPYLRAAPQKLNLVSLVPLVRCLASAPNFGQWCAIARQWLNRLA